MAKLDVKEQLKARFDAPLEPGADRRIVIWHDEAGEFEEEFDAIAQAARDSEEAVNGTERPLRSIKAIDGGLFEAKYFIDVEDTQSDILVYRRRPAGDLDGDLLADVEFYAEHFQADGLSLLIESLGAVDTSDVRDAITGHRAFFNSQERLGKFVSIVPHAQGGSEVLTGMIAVLLGCSSRRNEEIVRAYALALADDGTKASMLERLEKYNLADSMGQYLHHVTGYEGPLDSHQQFMTNLLLSAFFETVPEATMDGLSGKYSPAYATFCLGIVHDWMEAGEDERQALYEATRNVESWENLVMRFGQTRPEAIMRSDIFPAIDEVLVKDIMSALAAGSDRKSEALEVLAARRGLLWAQRVLNAYDLIEIVVGMRDFAKEHDDGFAGAQARDVFNAYKNDWWRMDLLYRKLCEAYQRCAADDNEFIIEDVQALMNWGDNLYTSWFLPKVNDRWIEAALPLWESSGYVEGVPRQRDFYANVVVPELKHVKRVAVIISDAFRYAVASQLKEQLERKTTHVLELSAMQSEFPSITSFGMAALLPNNKITVDDEGAVLVNGKKTKSTEQRQAILAEALPRSKAIQYDKLWSMSSQDRKDLAADTPILYIYHNTIDAAGEKQATQSTVFEACETAVDQVADLIRILTGSMGFSRVIVTADHGFLYTHNALPEFDKIKGAEVGEHVLAVAERYAIVTQPPDSNLFVRVAMSSDSGSDITGISPRGFAFIKQRGAGRYAHGGVSLQEVCVPVLTVKPAGKKGGESSLAKDAEVSLLDTTRRVSSMLFGVKLYQPEPVSGKVAPCEYELVFVDQAGNQVSDVRHVMADRTSGEATERQFELRFSLKEGRGYSASDSFYLIARRKSDGRQLWREEYTIDIAFAPVDDFGF